MEPPNNIIRMIYIISERDARYMKFDIVESRIQATKMEAITVAKEKGWKDWDLYEMYAPYRFTENNLPTPAPSLQSWQEVFAQYPGLSCEYSVILYKK